MIGSERGKVRRRKEGVMLRWYVLFVKTGYEENVSNQISKVWRIDGLNPFVPRYDARFKKGGVVLPERKLFAPGYVFVESDVHGKEFYSLIRSFVAESQYIIKILRYGNAYLDLTFEMALSERSLLEKLLNEEHVVEMSQGFIHGKSIVVTSGPLVGLEKYIIKPMRHKRLAVLSLEVMGVKKTTKVGLEIVDKF